MGDHPAAGGAPNRQIQIGDRMFYVLPKGHGSPVAVFLPCVVINIGKKRIVIRLDGSRNHRNILPTSLCFEVPKS